MGLRTVSSILTDVRTVLNDESATASEQRWSDEDLVGFYNDAINQLALVRPDATATTELLDLAVGSRQSLPSGSVRLIKGVRNMGSDGVTPGIPIKRGDLDALNLHKPDWHSQDAVAAPKTYLYDDRDPKVVWCEPPSDGTGNWQIVSSKVPTAETTATVTDGALLSVDDVYVAPVQQWMFHRAFAVEISSLTSQQLSSKYERAFYQSLGIKYQGDRATSPNVPQPQMQLAGGQP